MNVYQAVFPVGAASKAELKKAALERAHRFGLTPTGSVELRTHHLAGLSVVIATVGIVEALVKEASPIDAELDPA